MKQNIFNNPAFVLGLFETGLGVIRSLGRKGIKVIGYDYKKDVAYYSKYVSPKLCPHPELNEKEFIEFLIRETKKYHLKPVLYITSDYFLSAIINNLDIISNYFLINSINKNLFEKIRNKYLQFQLVKKFNIPVPETIVIDSGKFDKQLIKKLKFPVFLKGLDSNQWRSVFGGSKKGFLITSENQLSQLLNEINYLNINLILQEYIEGSDTNHYKFNCYIDKSGIIRAAFCLQKKRQNPIHFGVGSLVESITNSQLFELGKKLFTSIGYRGVGSAEFKFDERDNQFKLIEINPRYWQQNSLATACGVNFPLIQYLDLTGQQFMDTFNYQTGIKWVNIYSDFDSFLSYRKEGLLNFSKWLQSLKGKKVFSDWALDDIKPGFYELDFGRRLIKIPSYLIKKML